MSIKRRFAESAAENGYQRVCLQKWMGSFVVSLIALSFL